MPAENIAEKLRIGQVILAAADIDYTEFRNMLLDGLLDVADHFTLYVNRTDRVLRYSEVLSTGARRLGRPQSAVCEIELQLYKRSGNISFVDPSNGENR